MKFQNVQWVFLPVGLVYCSLLFHLLKMIAFQIGKDMSYSELSNSLDISKHTVKRYLDILEKAFVIKRVSSMLYNRIYSFLVLFDQN